VTKHAALGFAEWMAITYDDKGIKVQALCPLGVRTTMIDDIGVYGQVLLQPEAIEPGAVADVVVQSIADGPFLIRPHPQVAKMYASRATDPAAVAGRPSQGASPDRGYELRTPLTPSLRSGAQRLSISQSS
jgi:NAD(P)-dependent dehydrogenase (short-subunit alcohol dehydrogenase family)